MKIILIRHGMTEGNKSRKYIGITDEALCSEGRALLSEKDYSSIGETDFIFVSPLLRCRETADIIFPGKEKYIIEELSEMDFGIFENRAFENDLEHSQEYQTWLDGYCEGKIPEGESKEEFTARCIRGFEKALSFAVEKKENNAEDLTLAFVVHGGSIMSVMSEYAVPRKAYYEWGVKNGQGYQGVWTGRNIEEVEKIL